MFLKRIEAQYKIEALTVPFVKANEIIKKQLLGKQFKSINKKETGFPPGNYALKGLVGLEWTSPDGHTYTDTHSRGDQDTPVDLVLSVEPGDGIITTKVLLKQLKSGDIDAPGLSEVVRVAHRSALPHTVTARKRVLANEDLKTIAKDISDRILDVSKPSTLTKSDLYKLLQEIKDLVIPQLN
jgi:hypothetical protein